MIRIYFSSIFLILSVISVTSVADNFLIFMGAPIKKEIFHA